MKKSNCLRWIFSILFSCLVLFASAKDVYLTSTGVNMNDKLTEGTNIEDPFSPYLNSVPRITQLISEVNSGSGISAITTRKFTFSSKGGKNTIYAIMAYPQQAGIYPAVMCLHGGGSNANALLNFVQRYAQLGYVTISIDLPGICDNNTTPYTTGPFKSKPFSEASRLDVSLGPTSSILVDAEVAGLEAFNYMRSLENVDAEKMGITGYSWGGYSTTMLSGLLGDKVKAAYSVFGSGFYDKGSKWKTSIELMPEADRNVWLTYLDAGRRASNMKAAYFIECETNDTYFWPEAVEATLKAVPGVTNHSYGPNRNHVQLPSGGTMQQLYFDYYLKGIGQPFVSVNISKTEVMLDSNHKLTISINAPTGITMDSVNLYYSETSTNWKLSVWKILLTQLQSDGTYNVVIPAELVAKNIDYFIYAKDNRTVVTGSYIFNTASKVSFLSSIGSDSPVQHLKPKL